MLLCIDSLSLMKFMWWQLVQTKNYFYFVKAYIFVEEKLR